MKVPISWLKEWVPLRASAEEIANRLTFAGFEVEAIEEIDGDKVLDISVTANRGDALSIAGIARELSALFKLKIQRREERRLATSKKMEGISVHHQNTRACPRYALAVLEGVTVRPSPEAIRARLEKVGVRSINNIVDVTNYILMERGQPLHAFDLKKIRGGKIYVRNAKEGEKLISLDHLERSLRKEDLVIADSEGSIALAGIMGGNNTEVEEQTTSIALECAYFDPDAIRKTARRLGMQSESSYRFERRVDPEGIPQALQCAIQMILDVAGGQIGSVSDHYPQKVKTPIVRFLPQEVSRILGGDWKEREIEESLKKLSFKIKKKSKTVWDVTPPSYRGDVERSVDLIEEVSRLQGLEKIPTTFPPLRQGPTANPSLTSDQQARHLLADLGLQETVHYSFVSPELLRSFFGQEISDLVMLANPLGQDQSVLRPSLLPSLVQATAYHHRHKILNFRGFELSKGFQKGKPERKLLSGLLSGQRAQAHWSDRQRDVDFYDVKGIVERLLAQLGLRNAEYHTSQVSYLHPGKSAMVIHEGEVVGVLGELHPDLIDRFELKGISVVFELEWERLNQRQRPEIRFSEFSRFPVVERDLALVLDERTTAEDVSRYIQTQDPLIQEVKVFDLYRGNQVPAGKKSLAFSVRIGHPDRTMTDEEIQALLDRTLGGLKQKFQAEVR